MEGGGRRQRYGSGLVPNSGVLVVAWFLLVGDSTPVAGLLSEVASSCAGGGLVHGGEDQPESGNLGIQPISLSPFHSLRTCMLNKRNIAHRREEKGFDEDE